MGAGASVGNTQVHVNAFKVIMFALWHCKFCGTEVTHKREQQAKAVYEEELKLQNEEQCAKGLIATYQQQLNAQEQEQGHEQQYEQEQEQEDKSKDQEIDDMHPDQLITAKHTIRSSRLGGAFVIGDVVRAKVDRTLCRALELEGVVLEVNGARLRVDCGDTIEDVAVVACSRVSGWEDLEIGDLVEVKQSGGHIYCAGRVAAIDPDKHVYEVRYEDCEEVETDCPRSRIRKLGTGRPLLSNRWKMAVNAVKAAKRLSSVLLKK